MSMYTKPGHCPHGDIPCYPYNRPARDSYGYGCERCPKDSTPGYPTSGSYQGSGFILNETNPYLFDTYNVSYGQFLNLAESVYTRITRRNDDSCINLSATFDMSEDNLPNTVAYDFLKKYTGQKYATLEGILPIIKNNVTFKLSYVVTDISGGTIHQATIQVTCDDMKFHFTDVKDRFVNSCSNVFVTNIPAMDFQGLYTITFTKLEAYAPMIDVKSHIQDDLNPYYQWTDNNMRITLQHDVIDTTDADGTVKIASIDLNTSFNFQANVTTRLRVSFIAFMKNLIAADDVSDLWEALYEPTDEVITNLLNKVATLEETIALTNTKLDEAYTTIETLSGQVEINKNAIIDQNDKITSLNDTVAGITDTIDDDFNNLDERVTKLENIPLALLRYHQGTEYVVSQLVWRAYGQLYQCTRKFTSDTTADTEAESLLVDISLGNLVPVMYDEDVRPEQLVDPNKVNVVNDITREIDYFDTIADAVAFIKSDSSITYKLILGEKYAAKEPTIPANACSNVTNISEVVLPIGITAIGSGAFNNCSGFKDITFPTEGFVSIGDGAFYGCTRLGSVTLYSGTTSIGDSAFASCSTLVTVQLPTGLESIGNTAFNNCVNLTSINLPQGLMSIGSGAFYGTALTSIVLPEGFTSINTGTFANMSKLIMLKLPSTLTDIGSSVIADSALTTISIPAACETIAETAFTSSALTEIIIDKPEGTISGSPWGATDATVTWINS